MPTFYALNTEAHDPGVWPVIFQKIPVSVPIPTPLSVFPALPPTLPGSYCGSGPEKTRVGAFGPTLRVSDPRLLVHTTRPVKLVTRGFWKIK